MYVIFPADEVVYLSYGRLIYVPNSPTPEGENPVPIRTNSLYDSAVNNNPSESDNVANISAKTKQSGSEPGTSRQILDRPSTSNPATEPQAKKKLLKLNFNLLKKNSQKTSDTPFSPRVRKSIGHVEKINLSNPEEAFRKFCITDPRTQQQETSFSLPTVQEYADKSPNIESKRSSSSSKTGKSPIAFQDDKDSKRSSKHSTSSSKSGKTDKNSLQTPKSSKKTLKKAQSLNENEISPNDNKSRKISTGSAPINEELSPLGASRRSGVINSDATVNNTSNHRSRRISSSSNPILNEDNFNPLGTSRRSINNSDSKEESSSLFKFHLGRRSKSKTPEPKSVKPELESRGFYPLSTSREKILEEPLKESPKKSRRNPFSLSFRRSKTPEVTISNAPSRPERKKEKQVVNKKQLERKLSFSDYLAESRVENRPQVLVLPPSGREKSKSKSPVLGLPTKSPVLGFFRKTNADPRPLGRDRTPGILHTPHTPFSFPLPSESPDFSQYNSIQHNSLDIPKAVVANSSRSKPPTSTSGEFALVLSGE